MTDPRARERYEELASDDALVGIDDAEARELAALAAALGETDHDAHSRAAAAVAVAGLRRDASGQMPAHLFTKIIERGLETARDMAKTHVAATPGLARTVPMTGPSLTTTQSLPPAGTSPTHPSAAPVAAPPERAPQVSFAPPPAATQPVASIDDARRRRREGFWMGAAAGGWLAAAAAVVVLVAYALRGDRDVTATGGPSAATSSPPPPTVSAPAPAPKPSPVEARAALVASGAPVLSWAATKDPAAKGAKGDVVWSDRDQRGFMRMQGLAKNDPAKFQYQLWIFDAERDDKFPVDGGVFDVTGDEVVVPVDARLGVGKAVLFAVTVEKPGGVVVSKRERIVLTAKPATG